MLNVRTKKFHGWHEPTPSQEKKWLERVALYAADYGTFPDQNEGAYEMHHVKGRTFSHNKVHLGRWIVLPMQMDFHNVNSNNPFNVTKFKSRYEERYGSQIKQFVNMCEIILDEDGNLPFEQIVLDTARTLAGANSFSEI